MRRDKASVRTFKPIRSYQVTLREAEQLPNLHGRIVYRQLSKHGRYVGMLYGEMTELVRRAE